MRSLLLVMLWACAYRAGSFTAWDLDFVGTRRSLGCVDLAIDRRVDHPTGPVIGYVVGNRCDRAVVIDLQHASVIARSSNGDVAMVPYDPEHELRTLPLDGRATGIEAIEYRAIEGLGAPTEVCVDAASIVEGNFPEWVCFEPRGPSS